MAMRPLEKLPTIRAKLGSVIVLAVAVTLLVSYVLIAFYLRNSPRDTEEIALTPLEFEILLALAREPGVVLSRDQLMDRVWGYRDYAGGRVVDSHVARIRRKLGEDGNDPRFIRTVHGVGYAFKE